MATLDDMLRTGALEPFDIPDWDGRLPIHRLYVTPALVRWVDETEALKLIKHGGRTLQEHLEQIFADFRCSERPAAGDLRRMVPTRHGIWKMHPVGLRVYGWCPARRTFAAVSAALEIDTKTNRGLNAAKLNEVREFIMKHHAEETIVRGDILDIFPI